MVLKATLVFIFGPTLRRKTLLRPRPKLNSSIYKPAVHTVGYRIDYSGEFRILPEFHKHHINDMTQSHKLSQAFLSNEKVYLQEFDCPAKL